MSKKRNGLIRKIQVAKQQTGLDEVTYRGLLTTATGKDSLRAMDDKELMKVVYAFYNAGWKDGKKSKRDTHGKPVNCRPTKKATSTTELMSKIEALLADKGSDQKDYVPWSYAASILKRMYKVDRLEWATAEQLKGVIAALTNGGKRKKQVVMLGKDGNFYKEVWRGNKWVLERVS